MQVNIERLTPKELAVLTVLQENAGISNKEIGEILHIDEQTAKNYLYTICRITGCKNRTELTAGLTVENSIDKKLTERETEVLKMLSLGATVKKVAENLQLSTGTVKVHKWRLMRKLDIHNRATLVHYAIRTGLIQLST